MAYDKQLTALLVIDPYNDFISEGGKVWDRLKGVAEANKCVPHMLQVLDAARKAELRVFYALHRSLLSNSRNHRHDLSSEPKTKKISRIGLNGFNCIRNLKKQQPKDNQHG